MGIPLTTTQKDLTQKQHAFLSFASAEYVNDEREFQILLHGGEVKDSERSGSVKGNARKQLKDPRLLERKT